MIPSRSSLYRDVAFLLPPGQARVLAFVRQYVAAVNEPCPAATAARRLALNPATVREYFGKLHRKGWLRNDRSPAAPNDFRRT